MNIAEIYRENLLVYCRTQFSGGETFEKGESRTLIWLELLYPYLDQEFHRSLIHVLGSCLWMLSIIRK